MKSKTTLIPAHAWTRALLCIINILFICSCSHRQAGPDAIDLSGTWELIPADGDFAVNAPPADVSPTTVFLPGYWNETLKKNNDLASTVWLRKTVKINGRNSKGPYILSLGRIGVADETYFNGTPVGSSGIIPPPGDILNYRTAWQTPRNYFIPPELIKHDGDNIIAIRVFSHLICGINDRMELAPEKGWKESRTVFGFPAITVAHAGMFTANMILFIIFSIIYAGDRKRSEYPLLLLVLSGSIFLHLLVLGFGWFANGLVMLKIMFGLYAIAYLVYTRTAELYFNTRIKHAWKIMAAFTAIILFSLAITPTTQAFVRYSGALYVVFSVMYHIYVPAILIMMIIRDPMRYWYLSIVTTLTLMMDLYYLYCLISMQLVNIPFHISQVPILTLLVIIIFVTEYNELKKENSSMAKALLGKTRDLQKIQKLFNSTIKGKFREEPREAINDVIEYLDGNYFEPYDRKALADRFNIKEDYMCQVFKKKTGTSISNYINTLRLEAAKKLLEDTSSRVVDIAFHVGFENLTHFHRLFKKMAGTTPASYREKMAMRKMIGNT